MLARVLFNFGLVGLQLAWALSILGLVAVHVALVLISVVRASFTVGRVGSHLAWASPTCVLVALPLARVLFMFG